MTGRWFLFLFVAVSGGAGVWLGWTQALDQALVRLLLGSIMILCGVVMIVPTLQSGDHFERRYPWRFRVTAIGVILLGAGHAAPNVIASLVLQFAGIAAMVVAMTRTFRPRAVS